MAEILVLYYTRHGATAELARQVARGSIGSDAFQEAPVANIMGAVAKHCFLVTDPTKLEATVRTAFEIARSGRPGRRCCRKTSPAW